MITFEIATPERVVYKETVDSLTLPTKDGEITVLPNHIPLVSVLVPGAITVRKGSDEQYLAVSGGFIEVQPAQISPSEKFQSGKPNTRVVVLADTAERAEELTVAAIEKARADAEQALKEKRSMDDETFAAAAAALERELARLKVVRKRRH
ncbi:ATP synthase F1 subunit epsilon [Candidatus Uhrbacteria bacterium]|nr:ATP synthase F1 subunit epsilon [Candidatus Uhrbacteria bacterium]